MYWNKTSENITKFDTTSETIKDPNTLNAVGTKISTEFIHTPVNSTELMGDVKVQITLRDSISGEVIVGAEKTSDIHLGSIAGFTSKTEQQKVVLQQIFKPMFTKTFNDLYVSLEKISTKNLKNMNKDGSKINAFSTNEIPRNAVTAL